MGDDRIKELEAVVADQKEKIEDLTVQLKESEELVAGLNNDLDVAQEDARAYEEFRDKAEYRLEVEGRKIQQERESFLSILRELEWDDDDHCPSCNYPWSIFGHKKRAHAPGCAIRIKIMELETTLLKRICVE